jgi:hypothetical protein
VLDDLVANHNGSPSRPLLAVGKGTTPADIGPEQEQVLRRVDHDRATDVRKRVDALNIIPGTKVRLLTAALKNAPKFVKGQEATWTPELYTVVKRAGVNSFIIDVAAGENPIWAFHALQVVKKALGQSQQAGPKIDKAVVAAQTAFAREISEEEQAANLAAPAREKRATKVDYLKLSKGGGRRYTLY